MKNSLVLLALGLATSLTVQAQTFNLGLKAGVNLGDLDITPPASDQSIDMKTSYYVGGLVEWVISDRFALQGEILYEENGAKSSYENAQYSGENTIKLHTLNVPISAKYYLIPQKFSVHTGIALGSFLKPTVETEETDKTTDIVTTDKEYISPRLEDISLSWIAGIEFKFNKHFFMDARYNLGLTNIYKEDATDPYDDNYEIKMNTIQAGLGYRF